MKTVTKDDLCALLGKPQPRPIQIKPILPKKEQAYHVGTYLSGVEHDALKRGVSALTLSGMPMNKAAFIRLSVLLTADLLEQAGVSIQTPTE